MADDVEFATALSEHDWDAALAGWRCSAVGIPGATVALMVNGVKQDSDRLAVNRNLRVIRWLGAIDERPTVLYGAGPSVVAVVTLTKKLTPVSVPVIIALIGLAGTIGSAVIAANVGRTRDRGINNVTEGANVTTRETQTSTGAPAVSDWAAQIQSAGQDELKLAILGERTYKDGEIARAEQILDQATRARRTGESDPYMPYRAAALYKLGRWEEADRVLVKLVLRVNHGGSRPRAEATIRALREISNDGLGLIGPPRVYDAIQELEGRLKALAATE